MPVDGWLWDRKLKKPHFTPVVPGVLARVGKCAAVSDRRDIGRTDANHFVTCIPTRGGGLLAYNWRRRAYTKGVLCVHEVGGVFGYAGWLD